MDFYASRTCDNGVVPLGSAIMAFTHLPNAWAWLVSEYDPSLYDRDTARFGVAAFHDRPLSETDHVWILVGIQKRPTRQVRLSFTIEEARALAHLIVSNAPADDLMLTSALEIIKKGIANHK